MVSAKVTQNICTYVHVHVHTQIHIHTHDSTDWVIPTQLGYYIKFNFMGSKYSEVKARSTLT